MHAYFVGWGYNAHGQLGDGGATLRRTPVPVSGLTGATQLAAGGEHTCALLQGGAVRCWGANKDGQLGDGSTTDSHTPVAVGLAGATMLAAGGGHTCALLQDGGAAHWGWTGDQQQGAEHHEPVAVLGLSTL